MRPFAQLRFRHMVWGTFSSTLIGLRIVPFFKTHNGLRIYSNTLKRTWSGLKDMLVFFGYVAVLVVTLVTPLFCLTGANTAFKDGSAALLNLALMMFQNFGYNDFFASEAPTFGEYRMIFMFSFWFVIVILVVFSQNVLLALVAAAYDEAREAEGAVERSYLALCFYRLWWILYSRWHRWLLRKTRYGMLEMLLATIRKPDSWWYQRVFVRWALSNIPEARLLAQLYTDPMSELVYLYSPWAWSRASPWDKAQLAPWDEQLGYPMYTWADVPTNGPGVRPRLRRLPPLFSSKGGPEAQARLPLHYNEADPIFALSEAEVDDLLDCVEAAWQQRMRYNAVVRRFTSMGWSERGRALLREGLLELYRRHRVAECTSTSVRGPAPSPGEAQRRPPDSKAASMDCTDVAAAAVVHVTPEALLEPGPGLDGDAAGQC
ncbi:hypothetical protein GPECTOR_16g718 [Gonium pectorale]|uniref:Ion transport domain-containing protein n=1 Tax=Gonium pectorale TaxID=33097 RepID=A0A150GL46_GONPE|nr:hypothetical protein GPECTOR_16g718 [Gonium pectorale]|eukprot:KXZ50543.1 hypothetical protein GPECTOR_16g718 [Gonium pectorale]